MDQLFTSIKNEGKNSIKGLMQISNDVLTAAAGLPEDIEIEAPTTELPHTTIKQTIIQFAEVFKTNLVDKTTEATETAKSWFTDVKNKADVTQEELTKAVSKIAEKKQKTVEEVTKILTDEGPKVLTALGMAASTAASQVAAAVADAVADVAQKVNEAVKK